MATSSKFIVVEHQAKRRGDHFDIRFKMPGSSKWASFATTRKDTDLPTETGKKITVVRTHDHTEKEALFTGTIPSGYGAGKLKKWDAGSCMIEKFKPAHIVVDFKGSKLKGRYHFVSTGVISKDYSSNLYMFFKGK